MSGTTATQAILVHTAPDDNPCTVQVSESPTMTPLVHDVDPALFPSADSDFRPGNLRLGAWRAFVIGRRTAGKALDEKRYSRALQAFTKHYYTVTCGEDTVSGEFTTVNPPLGNSAPDPIPFDPTAFGNVASPTIDYSPEGKDTSYIDPQTGLLVKRVTGPGGYGWRVAETFPAVQDIDSAWTDAANATQYGTSNFASISTPGHVLFLPFRDKTAYPYWAANYIAGYGSWDDLQVKTYGAASGSGDDAKVEICITLDSQTCATNWIDAALPAVQGVGATAPNSGFPNPYFKGWGVQFDRGQILPSVGKVNVSGKSVTAVSASAWGYFNTQMAPGARIYIARSGCANPTDYCTVASVADATHLTLVEDVGTLANADYRSASSGVLVRKKSGTSLIQINVGLDAALSQQYSMGENGAAYLCSQSTVTVSVDKDGNPITPVTGRLCMFRHHTYDASLYLFIPSTGESRLLSVLYGGGVIGGDTVGSRNFSTAVDSFDGTSFYVSPIASYGGVYRRVILQGIYDTGKAANCDYRAYHSGGGTSDYYSTTPAADCITWTNLTPISQGKDPVSQLSGFPDWDANIYKGEFTFTGVSGGYYLFYITNGDGQESPRVTGHGRLSDGVVVGLRNSWEHWPGRWGGVHTDPAAAAGSWKEIALNPINGPGSTRSLAGPYKVDISQVYKNGAWSNDTSLTNTYADGCSARLDARWQALGYTEGAAKCIQIRLSAEPYSDHGPIEERNKWPHPLIGTHPTWSMPSRIAEGDQIHQLGGTGASGAQHEEMLVVKKTLNSETDIVLELGRWAPWYDEKDTAWPKLKHIVLPNTATHPNGWQGYLTPYRYSYGAHWFIDATDPSYAWSTTWPAGVHGDFSAVATTPGNYTYVVGGCWAWWNAPMSTILSLSAESWRTKTQECEPTFHGVASSDILQSYPSMRQTSAPDAEKRWFIDSYGYLPAGGGQGGMYTDTVKLVPGKTQIYQVGGMGTLARKTLGSIGWAGRFLLKDKSGAGALTDSDAWNYCVVDYSGATCGITGEQVGDVYMNVPKASIATSQPGYNCLVSQYEKNTPCFSRSAAPRGAAVVQRDISSPDPLGARWRKVTMGMSGPGRHFSYYNARATPDGQWVFTYGSYLSGGRLDIFGWKLPPFPDPGQDPEPTTDPDIDVGVRRDFSTVHLRVDGVEFATKARVRFGYAEYGPPDAYYCTSRQEACTTGGVPFAWLGETAILKGCREGCTIDVPALPGRILYYVVDRLDDAGNVVASDPPWAKAIP